MGKLHRFSGTEMALDWEGALAKSVDQQRSKGMTGKLLIGPQDGAHNFRIRYFRIEPGGYSPLEVHPHDHGVFILHGQARVRMGSETVTVGPQDALYIPGNERHQLKAVGDDPLAFLCVIPPK